MKNHKKSMMIFLLCAVITGSILFTGCSQTSETSSEISVISSDSNSVSASKTAESSVVFTKEDSDTNYNEKDAVKITLKNTAAEISGQGAVFDNNTVKITQAGTYLLTGQLDDGKILISAGKDDTVTLVLQNMNITSSGTAAIYAEKCGKTILLLDDNSNNTITDNGEYTESDDTPNSAIYIKDDLTILGNGTLTVNANSHNGITSKDTLKITSGNLTVNAANNGITGKDNLAITGGTITVTAQADGLRSTYSDTDNSEKGHIFIENATLNLTAGSDAIQAEKNLSINSGTFTIKTGNGASEKSNYNQSFGMNNNNSEDSESIKGIKAGQNIEINGGTFDINSEDDSIHSSNVIITSGTLNISSGDDGIHADNTLTIKNGTINIKQSYEGLEAAVIDISDGLIDINASDDGINASDGSGSEMFGGMGGFGFGGKMDRFRNNQNSDTQNNNMPQMPDMSNGNMPEMPDMPNGSMPEMPDMPNDSMPDIPDMPNDSMPQMPDNPQSDTQTNQNSDNTVAITIKGGTIYVTAQGDAVDSNGDLNISGGTLIINGTTNNGDGILDHGGNCTVTGGTIIGSGTYGMLEMPDSSSTQNTAVLMFTQTQNAGTLVYVTDSSGNILAAMAPEKNYNCLVLSNASLKSGETYTVYLGGNASGEATHGYYSKATVTNGTKYTEFTISEAVTYANESGNTTYSGGMGGGMGRMNQGSFGEKIQNDQNSGNSFGGRMNQFNKNNRFQENSQTTLPNSTSSNTL